MNIISGGVNKCGIEVARMHIEKFLDDLRLQKCLIRLFFLLVVLAGYAELVAEIPEKHALTIERPLTHRLFLI